MAVQSIAARPTCVVSVAYLKDGTRLMTRPLRHAGDELDPRAVAGFVCGQPSGRFDLVFISGYSLVRRNSPTALTARWLGGWARRHRIPILLDLVPHEFAESVGSVPRAVSRLGGQATGFVAELRTVRGLGLCDDYSDAESIRGQMAQAAASLAGYGQFAVVQHQNGPETYAQAIFHQGRSMFEQCRFVPGEREGLGDRMLAEALVTHRLLHVNGHRP
jgi:hypothetical protein